MSDISSLWDFDDPAGSELRFRTAAQSATGVERAVLLTQVARALGLQSKFDEGHTVLDRIEDDEVEVVVRVALERGRLLHSAEEPGAAAQFALATIRAEEAGLGGLYVDALHMGALVAPPGRQLALTAAALEVARARPEPEAKRWIPSLLNNLGMCYADAGAWEEALDAFKEALALRQEEGVAGATRIARWMVGWALRNLGRRREALAIQQALKAELTAAGAEDPYVDEELELLTDGGS